MALVPLVGMPFSNLMALKRRKSSNINIYGKGKKKVTKNYQCSYAQLDKDIKNTISHRGKALDVLKKYFEDKEQQQKA